MVARLLNLIVIDLVCFVEQVQEGDCNKTDYRPDVRVKNDHADQTASEEGNINDTEFFEVFLDVACHSE